MISIIGWSDSALTQDIAILLAEQNITTCVLSPPDFLNSKADHRSSYIVSVNQDLALRKSISSKLNNENLKRVGPIVHHSSYIASSATISKGAFIFPFSTVGNNTIVSEDCILAPYSMIGHRSLLGAGSIMQPGSIIAGSTKVGEFCRLNLRSTVLDNIEVCDNVIIGAGALVTKSITEPGKYIGSPARKRG